MNKRNMVTGGIAMSMLLAMTAHFESSGQMRLTAYQDQGGIWTICNGITKGVSPGMTVTADWCERAQREEITNHSAPLARVDRDLPVREKVAFTDLSYNIGVGAFGGSTALRKLVSGDTVGACDAILMWKGATVNKRKVDCSKPSNGCSGIWVRRNVERDVCTGKISVRDAQILFGKLPVGGVLWEGE